MRLDNYLFQNGLVFSRNKASELIKNSMIKVDDKIIIKSSFKIDENSSPIIEILEDTIYVSRASQKLKGFLEELRENSTTLNIKDNDILDIGSSTGGFSQVLLEYNPKSISCVDVGSNQLHPTILSNPVIKSYEQCDIREFKKRFDIDRFEIITCDVSFISLHHIFKYIDELASRYIILLFKPQFEVGKDAKRDSNGKVMDENKIKEARDKFIKATKKLKWNIKYSAKSSIKGKSGNHEELFLFEK
jgi:23S rRNA (cytidine1920-2'-O)/16S rRNA (cytidine1409-2'-O)-methyltransferase